MSLRRTTTITILLALVLATFAGAATAEDEGPAIVGTVTDTLTGEPLPGIAVHLHRVEPEVGPSGPMATAVTAADGSYAFDDHALLGNATHVGIHAGVPGYEQLWRFIRWDGTTLPHTLDLDLYPTSGSPAVVVDVIDADTGATLPAVTMFLHYVTPDDSPIPFLPYEGSGAGAAFYRVDAGRALHVQAYAHGYLTDWSQVVTWDGADPVEVVVALRTRATDVPEDSTHAAAIDWLMTSGIADGYSDGSFGPGDTVTRAQMATFLTRAFELPAGDATYLDVNPTATHADAIAAIAAAGITEGYADGTFRPGAPVLRDQFSTFLARALDLDPVAPDFLDVPLDGTHAQSIGAVAAAGITEGYDDGTFRPTQPVTRGQMATFLQRALEG